MPSYSKNEIILVQYPFSNLSAIKVRPAVTIHAPHPSLDSLIVPLTSRTATLLPGEFILSDWLAAGLNVPSAVKRGIYTIHPSLIVRLVGQLSILDAQQLEQSVRRWLGL